MYLDWRKRDTYVVDIETDSLAPTVIWVMCTMNVLTGEKGEYTSVEEIQGFFERTAGALYVGHNILEFDAPALRRLASVNISETNCIDTMILSMLYSPNIDGGHSLGAWGERINKPKGDFDDFEGGLTQEMIDYCHQDVAVCTEVFVRLMKTLDKLNFSEQSIWIQHRLWVLLNQQRRNGFKFDGPRALGLYTELRAVEADYAAQVREVFPAERVHVANRQLKKKNGEFTNIYLKDRDRYEVVISNKQPNTYDAYEYVEFNLGSPPQRVAKLKELGWEPWPDDPKTKTGNPKPFEKGKLAPSLEAMLEENPVPQIRLLARWMLINGRANMVNTWLEAWNEKDGCIHGKLFVADTLRLRHQSPNTANIPAVRSGEGGPLLGDAGDFTYEARDLWVAREGRVLVGTDAAGLELRMLANYINRPAFTEQVVNGDPHQFNADTVGISRGLAKTLLYAIQYGAQPYKVSTILKVSVAEATKVRLEFLERLGLKEVMDAAIAEQERGRIELCDGSQVVCPSPHAALNYKLQGGGARVMFLAGILLDRHIRRERLDSLKVGDIHDEWQFDVHPDHAERHAELSVRSIRESGELLKLNVPLDGESKIGRTWAETH